MVYKNNPKTTGNCLCLENFVLYKIYKKRIHRRYFVHYAVDSVYPQSADFTFYGGLYRGVNLISVPDTHFDLDYYGGSEIMVTPRLCDDGGAEPACKDYSEEYQARYHEHLAQVFDERPWIWGTHVWNMFDFGCAARNERGVAGRNNKGLVTIDRKTRKDNGSESADGISRRKTDPQDRAGLSTWRTIGTTLANMVIGVGTPLIAYETVNGATVLSGPRMTVLQSCFCLVCSTR